MTSLTITGSLERPSLRGSTICRHCESPLSLSLVDLGKSPLCQTVLTERRSASPRSSTPCTRRSARDAGSYRSPSSWRPTAFSPSTPTSRRTRTRGWIMRVATSRRWSSGCRSAATTSSSSWRRTTAICSSTSCRSVSPCSASTPRRTSRRRPIARGVPTLVEFFGLEFARRLVEEGRRPRLVLGNNVLAQVPDINDFVAGVKLLLADGGTATFEFPHLATLIDHLEYDTIYHEHFSYFSLFAICKIFGAQGLDVIDVEEISTHGGSLRVFFGHAEESASASPPFGPCSTARTRRACATPRPTAASLRVSRCRSARSSSC